MTKTNTKIAELAAKNKENHAKRFALEVEGNVWGIQARAKLVAGPRAGKVNAVKKADAVEFVLVPVDQASGFDKIARALRRVGVAGRDVLPQLEEKFLNLEVNFGVVGKTESKIGEEVDVYGFASAHVDGFDSDAIVTLENVNSIENNKAIRETVVMVIDKAEMPESVAANAEAMKAEAAVLSQIGK
ncbi:hypothetical protein D1157_19355 [Anaerotruncus sp. X29]|nr:hypothetical protein [Anaerotruncus sp. X29]